MATFDELRGQLGKARSAREEAELARERARARRRLAAAQLTDRVRRHGDNDAEIARLQQELKQLDAQLPDLEAAVTRTRAGAGAVLDELVALAPPQRLVEQLDDATPILLLPLRLEVRFRPSASAAGELWIRAAPDDVAIDSHEPGLVAAEIAAGAAYWAAVAEAAGDEAAVLGAWRGLVEAFGPPRAAWIARATEPADGVRPPAAAADGWARPPRVRVLPERLVFLLYRGGTRRHEVVGLPITEPLVVGPDPDEAVDGFAQVDGELRVDPGMRWMVDFEEAERAGMAVRVALDAADMRAGFDRVMAVGVRTGSSPEEARGLVEALLDGHHHAAGLQVVAQGAATNHTGEGPAAPGPWTLDAADSFAAERKGPLFEPTADWRARRDGQRLADALGIDAGALQHVHGAGGGDAAEAVAMNEALWPGTLGSFLREMMAPVFTAETIHAVRGFFTRFVSGRGALPALRVGDQPYGVLPTTVFSRMTWSGQEDPILPEVAGVLHRLRASWAELVPRVARLGAGADPERELLQTLALHPASVEHYQRFLLGPEYLHNLIGFLGRADIAPTWGRLAREAAGELGVELGLDPAGPPRILELVFMRTQRRLDGPLIDEPPPSETRLLPALPGSGEPPVNYLAWLAGATVDALRDQTLGTDDAGQRRPPPRALLYLLARHALLLQYWDAASQIHVREGLLADADRVDVELRNLRADRDRLRWDHLEMKAPGVTGNRSAAEFLHAGNPGGVPAGAVLAETRQALASLAAVPTARLQRLCAEHLDLCAYRLDAWLLGLAHQRLESLRGADPQAAGTGVHLGAFGWLEDVRPRPGAPAGGFVHAPSMNHAVAAAVLRSAALSHEPGGQTDAMSIRLTSGRARRAASYLEGVRDGQPLAALLGYRFERGLHDRNPALALDAHLLALRGKFPLVAGQVTPGPSEERIELVESRNVVDGLRLAQAARTPGYPYGIHDLPPRGSDAALAIEHEVDRLVDDLDAVGDLALAESVYQLAQGNHAAAGAIARAVSEGGHPPEPAILRTPRSGLTLAHRAVCLLDPAAVISPWPGPATPRALAEPRLNRWLGLQLGDPAAVRCRASWGDAEAPGGESSVTLAELGLQPIDVAAMGAPDASGVSAELRVHLEYRLRVREGLADDVPVRLAPADREAAWGPELAAVAEVAPLLAAIAELLGAARGLVGADLLPASDVAQPGPEQDAVDAGELRARIDAAAGALRGLRTTLAAAVAGVPAAGPVSSARADALRDALYAAATATGPDVVPATVVTTERPAIDELLGRAARSLAELDRRLAALDAGLAAGTAAALLEAARGGLRGAFPVLPVFRPTNAPELEQALSAQASLLAGAAPLPIDEWLEGAACVRPRLAALEAVFTLAGTLAAMPPPAATPVVAQVPYQAGDRWLGLRFVADQPRPGGRLSIAAWTWNPPAPSDRLVGLMVDEWIELIPDPVVTTGLAFHCDRPGAEAPQALLLIVPPERRGRWRWDDLVDAVIETFDLVRLRAVEPDLLAQTAWATLVPALVMATARRPVTIATNLAANVGATAALAEEEP